MQKYNIKTDLIKPFFQVIIYKINEDWSTPSFMGVFQKQIEEKHANPNNRHYVEISEPSILAGNPLMIHLVHKSKPSWYEDNTILKSLEIGNLENVEHVLFFLYEKNGYLLLHSTSDIINNIAEQTFEKMKEGGSRIHKLGADKIQNILNYNKINMKSLGIGNVFRAGSGALEAKSYFGQNVASTLTPTQDGGYALNYCLGSETRPGETELSTIGCSTTKAKVWRTWVQSMSDFQNQCNEIVDILDCKTLITQEQLKLLVTPLSYSEGAGKNKPISFFMDFILKNKGYLILDDGKSKTENWYCFLPNDDLSKICFAKEGIPKKDQLITAISCTRGDEDQPWRFDYETEGDSIMVIFHDPLREKDGRSRFDLVEYLNSQCGFTILFEKGIAYRNRTFYKNEHLIYPFSSVETSISWKDVDIRKEDDIPGKGYCSNILNRIESHVVEHFIPIIGINDNGKEEIADLIILTKDSFILVHAKYSANRKPGLRVGDLQVVTAQALKNLHYFQYDAYSNKLFIRITDENKQFVKAGTSEEIKFKIQEHLRLPFIKKECWIVQPGISKKQLENKPTNKIHMLLNFVAGQCTQQDIKFRFFSSI
jgi:hypothetical protein